MRSFFKTVRFSFGLLYKSSKLMFAAYFLLQVACSVVPLMSVYVLRDLLNALVDIESVGWSVLWPVCLYAVILISLIVLQSMDSLLHDLMYERAMHKYAYDFAQKMSVLPMSFIDTAEGRDKIDEARYLMTTAVNFPTYLIRFLSVAASFVIAYMQIASFNIGFSLLFISLSVPGIIFQMVFSRKADRLRRAQAPDVRKFCYYRWMLTDAWPAKDVRMYDLTKPISKRYDEEKKHYRDANKKLDKKKMWAELLTELVKRSGEIAFSIFVIIKAVSGEIGVGDTAMYISFAVAAIESFEGVAGILVYGVIRSSANMKYVFDFFERETPERKTGTRKLESFESLVFDNVYFKYPASETYVLQGVSFELKKGDKLSIVGVNGSGKSTIVKLMLGLYEIESGTVLINGYPVSDYDIQDVRRLFSALFQSFVQYPLTLRENIALSDLDRMDNDKEIESVLVKSGVFDEIKPKLKNGLDSFMTRSFDDEGTELSRGQWQKIALSRAYFKNAEIVIFDEPSAALDAEAEDRIFKNFETIADGKTSVMISHRISSARISNKIIVLDGGKITEHGTHDELMELSGLYAKLYNLQRNKYTIKEEE